MSDIWIFIIVIGLVAIVLIIPMMIISERKDDISQSVLEAATSELLSKSTTAGVIKVADVDEYRQKLSTTGNSYDIQIEVQHLDENPGKKQDDESTPGLAMRYSSFDILDYMYPENADPRDYVLKKGDIVVIISKNTNIPPSQEYRRVFYKITGKGTYQNYVQMSAMALNSGKTN